MKGGILEVLLVSAKGLRQTSLIVKPAYFVIIEGGNQVRRSKTSKGFRVAGNRHEIYWNEKFTFEFPISECQKLTHLKFTIKDEHFCDGKFVGETMVYLEGLVTEGNNSGFIELPPTPYNVVLDDDSYKGELKIGLRFTANTDIYLDGEDTVEEEKGLEKSIFKKLVNIWKISWWRFSFFCRNLESDDKHKET